MIVDAYNSAQNVRGRSDYLTGGNPDAPQRPFDVPKMLSRMDAAGVDGALFSISDNGPGIPKEYHEIIFRKFEQVKTPNAPRVRSSGLGLAFCKLVIESHGGRIWVHSEGEGKGSSFHFVLPTTPPASVVPVNRIA